MTVRFDATGRNRLGRDVDVIDQILDRDPSLNNREIDLLTGGTADIDARVRALGSVISDADLDWTVDFSHRDGEVVQVVRAKHRRAPEVSPIGIKLDTVFGPEHEDLEAAFRRISEYGASEKITLPPDVIRSFEVTGPELFAQRAEGVELTFLPAAGQAAELPFALVFQDENGAPLSSHAGVARHAGQASRGSSLTVDFYSSLELSFLFPHDLSHGGQLRYQLDLDGTDPFVALRVLQLLDALETSTSVVMQLNGEQLARAALTDRRPVVSPSTRQDFERFRAFADDLAIVQRHCETYFSIPENVNAEDRLFVRCARLLIDGHCVVVPRMKILKAHLNGHDSPEIRGVLEADAGVFLVEHERFGVAAMPSPSSQRANRGHGNAVACRVQQHQPGHPAVLIFADQGIRVVVGHDRGHHRHAHDRGCRRPLDDSLSGTVGGNVSSFMICLHVPTASPWLRSPGGSDPRFQAAQICWVPRRRRPTLTSATHPPIARGTTRGTNGALLTRVPTPAGFSHR